MCPTFYGLGSVSGDPRSGFLKRISLHLEVLKGIRGDLAENPDAAREAAARLGAALAIDRELAGSPPVAEAAKALKAVARRSTAATLARRLDDLETALTDLLADDHPTTALVVEDDDDTARLIRDVLEGCGFPEVLVTGTDAEARALARKHALGAVVIDLALPDGDGRSLLFELRRLPGLGAIPIVVVSGVQAATARAECLAYGANDFLAKPLDPEELTSSLTSLLEPEGARARVADPLLSLPARSVVETGYDRLRRREGTPGVVPALALLEVEPTADAGAEGRVVALLGALAEALRPYLDDRDTLGRWSANDLVLLSATRSAADLEALLTMVGETLGWPEGTLVTGVTTPGPEDGFVDAVSQAGLRLAAARAGSVPGEEPPAAPRSIVLAEDDPITSALVCHRLERSGFRVRHFDDGSEALKGILADPPSLAILDVQMPGMDGFELLARMREERRTRNVRVIVFTSLGSESDVSRGFQLGADDYLVKPFSPRELLARVLRLIRD